MTASTHSPPTHSNIFFKTTSIKSLSLLCRKTTPSYLIHTHQREYRKWLLPVTVAYQAATKASIHSNLSIYTQTAWEKQKERKNSRGNVVVSSAQVYKVPLKAPGELHSGTNNSWKTKKKRKLRCHRWKSAVAPSMQKLMRKIRPRIRLAVS